MRAAKSGKARAMKTFKEWMKGEEDKPHVDK